MEIKNHFRLKVLINSYRFKISDDYTNITSSVPDICIAM